MKSIYYILVAILLFYLDTVLTFLSPIMIGPQRLILVPHLVFLYLMLIAVYKNTSIALILGILLGTMQDLFFGQIYGVYLFGYIVFVLLADKFLKVFFRDHIMVYAMLILGVVLLEIFVVLIYLLLGLIDVSILHFIIFRILPTAVLNALLLVFLYFLGNKFINQTRPIDTK
ncbi:rod shape-determining protein MreD [Staphylococcus lutrae]|uniref:Rod shape-determining protein MreD n=1 Tax=Staphylococcus lutrae TaxID=155085 RepID=A0AAC9RQZ0_9STAP|nr:rod shape-determining protein MreD [Staphylococcus lutrae]ARJ49954.1 rod shape-determining protein MreD [Staphylococcus lutrae]PNZ38885.1 rod shape-determining protein MreD [Staphylococcus lutrae]